MNMRRDVLVVSMFVAGILIPRVASAQQAPAAPTVSGPTLAEARRAIAAAQAAATKMGVGLSCAVLDSRGGVVAIERMDNAPYFTTDVARSKATVSAAFGAPSGALTSLASTGILDLLPGKPLAMQGAVPISHNNQRYGAIGCSGGTGQQDEDGAKAGAATF
jgi:uncharacterized protein GlcG (DUF336 family)